MQDTNRTGSFRWNSILVTSSALATEMSRQFGMLSNIGVAHLSNGPDGSKIIMDPLIILAGYKIMPYRRLRRVRQIQEYQDCF